MCVSVAQYLHLVQVPPLADEHKKISQHPTRICRIIVRIGEANKSVVVVYVVEKAVFVTRKRANGPYEPELTETRRST